MNINSAKLAQVIKSSQYGTGTLSIRLGVHPDLLQKIIATGNCEEDLFKKLEEILAQKLNDEDDVEVEAVEIIDAIPEVPSILPELEDSDVSPSPPTMQVMETPDEVAGEENGTEVLDVTEEDVQGWLTGTNTEEIELARVSELVVTTSVNKLKLLVSKGEADPAQLLQAEQERDTPRVSLTDWLKKKAEV